MTFKPAHYSQEVADAVGAMSATYNLPRYYMFAVIDRESGGDPTATNPNDGGLGLVQLTGENWNGSPYPHNLAVCDNNFLQWTYDMGFSTFGVWLDMCEVSTLTNSESWKTATANLRRWCTSFVVRWYQQRKGTFSSESSGTLLRRTAYNWRYGLFKAYDPNDPYLTGNWGYDYWLNEYKAACEADDGIWNGTPTMAAPPPGGSGGGGVGGTSTYSWVTPRTWTDGEVVRASQFNTHIRDNQSYAYHMGYICEAASTIQASSTSMTGVDLVTLSGLSIPPHKPLTIICQFRKTTAGGSLLSAGCGLKINGTIVSEAPNSNNSDVGFGAMSNTSTNESAISIMWVPQRNIAPYIRHSFGEIMTVGSSGTGEVRQPIYGQDTTAWPTNTVTAIAIRGRCASNSATVYINTVHVYSHGYL